MKQRGGISTGRTLGWAAKVGAILACPPLAILIGINELANLIKWRKTAKGKWSEEEENKMLSMKMMAGNPVAAMKLLDKTLSKSTLPDSHRKFFSILSKNLARGISMADDIETMGDLRPTRKK
ncbi:MAG: hypothetical protein OEV49_06590 [candidate division Zixibacteria bacterium]|nr:hypothetical protein [candidate division Zixibacteria bacterium]MDH3935890.1 hypothetical protein [candidate division Zixibacteria bacterium]MDH4032694.1 hypothetical protein [candidate division Zixibacteria bacterium]